MSLAPDRPAVAPVVRAKCARCEAVTFVNKSRVCLTCFAPPRSLGVAALIEATRAWPWEGTQA